MTVGFIGIGVMGQPMSLNLARAGHSLVIWNRSSERCKLVKDAGAFVAQSSNEVFHLSRIVILMMSNSESLDAVLGRGSELFAANVRDHIIVHMGTTSAEYSKELERDIKSAGGQYVEAPVSGSRKPAELGQLVAMVAGDTSAVKEVLPLLKPMCHEIVVCGTVPSGLLMKLSVNSFLIPMVTALAESSNLARNYGLNLQQFQAVLDAGPMSSAVSRIKVAKLVNEDFEVQASIVDVLKNNRLAVEAAQNAKVASPLLNACKELYTETVNLGHGAEDMVAVVRAIEARTKAERTPA